MLWQILNRLGGGSKNYYSVSARAFILEQYFTCNFYIIFAVSDGKNTLHSKLQSKTLTFCPVILNNDRRESVLALATTESDQCLAVGHIAADISVPALVEESVNSGKAIF